MANNTTRFVSNAQQLNGAFKLGMPHPMDGRLIALTKSELTNVGAGTIWSIANGNVAVYRGQQVYVVDEATTYQFIGKFNDADNITTSEVSNEKNWIKIASSGSTIDNVVDEINKIKSNYVKLSGDTMTGTLNVGENVIIDPDNGIEVSVMDGSATIGGNGVKVWNSDPRATDNYSEVSYSNFKLHDGDTSLTDLTMGHIRTKNTETGFGSYDEDIHLIEVQKMVKASGTTAHTSAATDSHNVNVAINRDQNNGNVTISAEIDVYDCGTF